MINLKKTQVNALLKIMGKGDDTPILANAYITTYKDKPVLVATNRFVLTMLYLDEEDVQPIMGKLIRRSAIEKWYKLATAKSRLTTTELVTISEEDFADNGGYNEAQYPNAVGIVEKTKPQPSSAISFNAPLAVALQDLHNDGALKFDLSGHFQPMISEQEEGIYLLMPIVK